MERTQGSASPKVHCGVFNGQLNPKVTRSMFSVAKFNVQLNSSFKATPENLLLCLLVPTLRQVKSKASADLRARCYREAKVSNLLVWGAQQTGSKEQRHAKFARSATVFLTGITKLINKVLCSATGQQKAANICNGAASLAGNGDRQGLPQSNSTGSVQRGQTVSRRRRGAGDGRAADCLRVLTAEAKIGPLHPCPQPTPPRPR